MNQFKVLHLVAHLGGGVGKALSGLVETSIKHNSEFKHIIVSLEENKKTYFKDKIDKYEDKVIESPDINELENIIKLSDIVQLEWWNNPVLIKNLCSPALKQPIRLITWCHNNGLFSENIKEEGKLPPVVPKNLILKSDFFIFTNECSSECKELKEAIYEFPDIRDRLGAIYASGGFKEFPDPKLRGSLRVQISETIFKILSNKRHIPRYPKIPKDISVGYFGTMNFAKLHPSFVEYIAAANGEIRHKKVTNRRIKELSKVKMIGECSKNVRGQLNQQCNEIGEKGLLHFTGYVPESKLVLELSSINILAYILNPEHYGTTENSLLEAMSMGIIPVVLDNPAESCLVDNYKTGIIVRTPKEFGEAILYLYENPNERKRLGINAARTVRERFSVEKTEARLNKYYRKLMKMDKKKIDFKKIFTND